MPRRGLPIYSAKAVQFRTGHPRSPIGIGSDSRDEFEAGHECTDSAFIWTYTSPQFSMAQSDPWTSFCRGSSSGLKRGNKPLKKWHIRQSVERVTRSIDESLERLHLDYVDILQCHDIESGSLDQIVNETIPALQKLKQAGKIRFIGITRLPLGVFTYVLDRVPPGTVDVILSYCHYGISDSTLEDLPPYLKTKGVGVISASPLAMGLLTESGPPEWHPASPELKAACQAAAAFCKEKGKNISKLAMQYSLLNKDISSILDGMNSVKQMNSLSLLLKVCHQLPEEKHSLLAYEAGRFNVQTRQEKLIADVRCEPILHMRHFQATKRLPDKLIHQILDKCRNGRPISYS